MLQIGNGSTLCSVCFGLMLSLVPSVSRAQQTTDAATPAAPDNQPTPALTVPAEPADSNTLEPVPLAPDAGIVPPEAESPTPAPSGGRQPLATPAEAAAVRGPAEPAENAAREGKKKKGKRKQKKLDAINADVASSLTLGDPWGDTKDQLRVAGLSFRFLLQTHYRHTIAAASESGDETYRIAEGTLAREGDGWGINRFFFRIVATPSRYLSLKLITDFAEFRHSDSRKAVKQAYVELKPLPSHLHFQVGIVKLPFSILELDPIAKHEFSSMGDANYLTTQLGFAGRDVGAQTIIAPFRKPKYLEFIAGAFGGHAEDENRSVVGAVGARLQTRALKGFRFGIDFVDHPTGKTYLHPFDTASKDLLPNPDNPNYPRSRTWSSGQAYSADITFSRARLMLRAEAMTGTRVDFDTRYGANRWGAVWGIAAYRFNAGPIQLQPAIRAEWLDTDWEHNAGVRRQLSVALAAFFSKTTRLLVDVTRSDIQQNSPALKQPLPLREVPYSALDNTRVVGQLQIDL